LPPTQLFIVKVTLFFYISMASHLIARERPSNMIDIAYLYYLPFCQAFTSNDRLHARTAPLFCEQGQTIVNGKDLKAALQEINLFYLRHEEEIEKVGIMRFAPVPPPHLDNVVTQLWDTFMPGWREREPTTDASGEKEPAMTPEKLVDLANRSIPVPSTEESDYVFIKRKAMIRKGRWRLMPPEVEDI
jgi:hypothetical protein